MWQVRDSVYEYCELEHWPKSIIVVVIIVQSDVAIAATQELFPYIIVGVEVRHFM